MCQYLSVPFALPLNLTRSILDDSGKQPFITQPNPIGAGSAMSSGDMVHGPGLVHNKSISLTWKCNESLRP